MLMIRQCSQLLRAVSRLTSARRGAERALVVELVIGVDKGVYSFASSYFLCRPESLTAIMSSSDHSNQSESEVFSGAKRTITAERKCLSDKVIEACECLILVEAGRD
jgi:hypothetical protein